MVQLAKWCIGLLSSNCKEDIESVASRTAFCPQDYEGCRKVNCNKCEYFFYILLEILKIQSEIGSLLVYTHWILFSSVWTDHIDVPSPFQTKQAQNYQHQGYYCQAIMFPTIKQNLNFILIFALFIRIGYLSFGWWCFFFFYCLLAVLYWSVMFHYLYCFCWFYRKFLQSNKHHDKEKMRMEGCSFVKCFLVLNSVYKP